MDSCVALLKALRLIKQNRREIAMEAMMKFSELDRELAARMHGRNFYDQRPCEASARNGNLTMLPMTPSNVVLRRWLMPSLENIFKIQRCNTV
jgi:hypothetical protein